MGRNGTQLTLDREATTVLRAALKFTAKLNEKCQELADMLCRKR
jgi:hypothetical protein